MCENPHAEFRVPSEMWNPAARACSVCVSEDSPTTLASERCWSKRCRIPRCTRVVSYPVLSFSPLRRIALCPVSRGQDAVVWTVQRARIARRIAMPDGLCSYRVLFLWCRRAERTERCCLSASGSVRAVLANLRRPSRSESTLRREPDWESGV